MDDSYYMTIDPMNDEIFSMKDSNIKEIMRVLIQHLLLIYMIKMRILTKNKEINRANSKIGFYGSLDEGRVALDSRAAAGIII
jgi:hypothetical protein